MNPRIYILIYVLLAVSSSWSKEVPSEGNAGVITFHEAIEMALEHNKGILAARDAVREAEAGVTIARSGFLPTIDVQGSYTRLAELPAIEIEIPGLGTKEFQMGEMENYVARASLQQPLFTWGKILGGYKISKLNLDATREDYRKQENELVFDVTKSFYSILVLEELVKLTEDAYKQTQNHVNAVEKRYNAGVASKFDLLRARVQLKNMEPQVIKVKNGLEIAKTGFKTLIGLPQDSLISLEGGLKYEPIEIDLEKSIKEAEVNRPEIKSLALRKRMASEALLIVKKANWPTLAFIANYDYKKPVYFKNAWGTDWNVTVALQMPIFTGLGNIGKMREARYRLSRAEHGLNLLKEGIELEIRVAYLGIEEAKKLVESQKENIVQAEEALSIVEERYKQGLATSLEVMDTQLALTQAKTNWLQSLSDYLITRARLEKALGK